MRVKIPELERKEAFAYLRKNCDKIVAQKRSLPIVSDDMEFGYSVLPEAKKFVGTKAKPVAQQDVEVEGEVTVEVIANMSGWCDSYMDVMIKDSWKRSINTPGPSGQKLVYHLKNHDYSTDAIIGRDPELFTQDVDLSVFNFKSDLKKAQALMMRSVVCQDYDEKCFMLYEDGQVKQHSIGLRYIKLYLCMDSEEPEDAQYKDNWDKYYPQVINKDKADSKGYFFAVVEAEIKEVSVVLFGANELTPVTSISTVEADTEQESGKADPVTPSFDLLAAIKATKFIN